MKKVAIIDCELGNLFSVKQACLTSGVAAFFSHDYKELATADAVILPGVGAFGQAMQNLKKYELDKVLPELASSGKPIMGVCLGLQLLFESSDEFGNNRGLGIFKGTVRKFPTTNQVGEKVLIPQINWNKLKIADQNRWKKSPLKSLTENSYVYFVHSYFVAPSETDCILSTTNYCGIEYASSVMKENVFAVQFHPEKSGKAGIEIYKDWLSNT